MKKFRFILCAVLIIAVFSALGVCAYADDVSTLAFDTSRDRGWYSYESYTFCVNRTLYQIPMGTVCSRYQNSSVYGYVYPIQYILEDFSEYYNNQNYNPNGLDGIFGTGTESATAYYQGRKGLSADGRVGDNTWSSFVSQWTFGVVYN